LLVLVIVVLCVINRSVERERERDRERKKKKTIIFVDDQVCNMVGSRSEVIGEEGGEE